MKKLLFEIGLEELPASFICPSLKQLENNLGNMLLEANLSFKKIETYSTPRRLSLIISDLAEKQKDINEEIKGPPKRIALDENNELTKAGLGFMRKFNAEKDDIFYKEYNDQQYLYLVNHIAGEQTLEILPDLLIKLLNSLNFPKTMSWGNGEYSFARPIRFLVAIYGKKIINFSFAGVSANNLSRGHRFLANDKIEIKDPNDYVYLLEKNYVIADLNKRRDIIKTQIKELEKLHHFNVVVEKDLLEEVVNLVEYPTVFLANFDDSYLQLPKEVITTPMQEHQRYFPVIDSAGNLISKFVGVRNGDRQYLENVIAGNEKVLDARLSDAKFFYEEDLKKPLSSYNEMLKKAVFQEDIGTIYQKVQRIEKISTFIYDKLDLTNINKETLMTAAKLSKADLATLMVNEFPELQGIMGQKYALEQAYSKEIANAIAQHYMPKSSDAQLPESDYGAIIAISDKLDTIISCLAVGLSASGSQDPYALRRKAAGIIKILIHNNYKIDLYQLFKYNYSLLETSHRDQQSLWQEFWEFFKIRIKSSWDEFSYDIIDSILENDNYNLSQLYKLAKAITQIKTTEKYSSLLAAYKRANNLANKAEKDYIFSERLLKEKEEQKLYQKLIKISDAFDLAIKRSEFEEALTLFSSLEAPINLFFDNVMVMVEDKDLKNNRLALLQKIINLIKPVTDLSKLVE